MFGSPKLIGTTGTTGTHVVNSHLLLLSSTRLLGSIRHRGDAYKTAFSQSENGGLHIIKRRFSNHKM